MSRVALLHWKPDGAANAARIESAGFDADSVLVRGPNELKELAVDPPDAFVVDVGTRNSDSEGVATWLRQRKATRHVPIVLVGGDKARMAAARTRLPDVTFCEWRGIRGAIRTALGARSSSPVVPGTMDAYRGRTTATKLGIKPGSTLVVLDGPADTDAILGPLPKDVRLRRRALGPADRVLLFADDPDRVTGRLPAAKRALARSAGLWIAWQKGTEPGPAALKAAGTAHGLVASKICALDANWSALYFTPRGRR